MTAHCSSDTFKILWKQIIEELLVQACESNLNYCIQFNTNTTGIHIQIEKKFEEYRNKALHHMTGTRLDRHKLAACICGAIVEVQPLVGLNGAKIIKNTNEIIAIYAALNIIKFYMIYELLENSQISEQEKYNLLVFFKENFDMESPSINENICDTKSYRENMANALYRSHHNCIEINKTCYHFDIWAYSKIFYHLEVYNKERLSTIYTNFTKKSGV